MNQPLTLTDPSGMQAGASTGCVPCQLAFAARNPTAAGAIGEADPQGLSDNISSVASRFAVNSAFSNRREGGEMNALRHVIWSAAITAQFGADIAKDATDAHEGVSTVTIPEGGKMPEQTADTAVDLENNAIGIEIGKEAAEKKWSNKEIANAALKKFETDGLYVTKINGDQTTIVRTTIGANEANITRQNWANRNDQTGLTPDKQKELEEQRRKQKEAEHNRRLGRDRYEE